MKPARVCDVEPQVMFHLPQVRRRHWLLVVLALTGAGLGVPARAEFGDGHGPLKPVTAPAQPPAPVLDEILYNDGDRVRGHFVKREGDTIVFQSERFGLLRVPAASVTLTLAKPAAGATSAAGATAAKAPSESRPEVWSWPFTPVALAHVLKEVFGSWHGKFAVSAEVLNDTAEHNSETAQLALDRKWKGDEVKADARYDFGSTDHVPSTDIFKADALWRHDLPDQFFTIYQATLEWNRNFFTSTTPPLPADYVLLQQEAGAGINLFTSQTRKLRTGVSENIFSVWTTPTPTQAQDTHTAESVFVEGEMKLPWRVSVTDRGIYYYSIARNTEGWENHFEVDKKLTETLTMGVQHEFRTNDPGVRVADYRRLKFLLGFDF